VPRAEEKGKKAQLDLYLTRRRRKKGRVSATCASPEKKRNTMSFPLLRRYKERAHETERNAGYSHFRLRGGPWRPSPNRKCFSVALSGGLEEKRKERTSPFM